MNNTLDFQAKIDGILRILSVGEYTNAATECVMLSEQALRRVVRQYIDQIDAKVKEQIQEAARKRVRGDGGFEKLTMGQMVNTLRETKFLEEWARLTGKSLSSLQVLDLDNLTKLRNKVIHEGAEATRTEAEFLLHSVKMILETFGLLTFEASETPTTQEENAMSTAPDKPQGGTQFGNVSFGKIGGNPTITQIGGNNVGDIVGGDKVIRSETTTTTVTYGFKQDADKEEFLKQIDELRAALREIKGAIESLDGLDEDKKDDLAVEVMQQVKDLKTVKDTAEATPVGKEPPKDKAQLVGSYLDKTTTLMKKLKKMGEAIAGASEKIIPAIVKALPLLASVRRLFGLP